MFCVYMCLGTIYVSVTIFPTLLDNIGDFARDVSIKIPLILILPEVMLNIFLKCKISIFVLIALVCLKVTILNKHSCL